LFSKSKNNHEKQRNATLSFNTFNKINKKEYNRVKNESVNEIPDITKVILFFQENGALEIEAKKFFYYYDSKAWLIGKNIKMVNWKSGAMKWILSSISSIKEKPKVDGSNDKNYDIPL